MAQVQPCLGLKKQQQHASRGINSLPKSPRKDSRCLTLGLYSWEIRGKFGSIILSAHWLTAEALWVILGYFLFIHVSQVLSSSLSPSRSLYLHFFLTHSEVSHRSRCAEGGRGQRPKLFTFNFNLLSVDSETSVWNDSCSAWRCLFEKLEESHAALPRCFARVLVSLILFDGGDVCCKVSTTHGATITTFMGNTALWNKTGLIL